MGCYIAVLRWKMLLFLLLAIVIIAAAQVRCHRKWASSAVIFLLLTGFVAIKWFSNVHFLLGYSVFAFAGISYLVDQYKAYTPYSVIDVWLYLFFFPKMLAGPIVRASELIPQLCTPWQLSKADAYAAFKLVVYGLFLKFILADTLLSVSFVGCTGINLLLKTMVWGVKFYFDFYAYSLLAVGGALVFGIHLPFNFNKPYLASSFKDFWKRWNLTLSSWLRDYIYLPLGGSQCSAMHRWFNIIITFLISACWHGLSFPYLLWGMVHGILVGLSHCKSPKPLQPLSRSTHFRVIGVFIVSTLLWQLFRLRDIEEIASYCHSLSAWVATDSLTICLLGLSISILVCIDSRWMDELMLHTGVSIKKVHCEVALLSFMLMALLLCPGHYTVDFFYFNF